MAIETAYFHASGVAHDDCAFIGQRFDGDRGYRPGASECWVMQAARQPDGSVFVTHQYGTQRWFTGLWRSLEGKTYVSDGTGEVHHNADTAAEDSHLRWTRHKLKSSLDGIWGLDDHHVFTWGATLDDQFLFYRWDGKSWAEMPSPGFDVRSVHGLGPRSLWAGGLGGALAHWDGSGWTRVSLPLADDLTSVFAAGADEIYATTARGSLLEGSRSGWGRVADGPGPGTPLFGVTKWGGELWVAAGPFGLLRRKGRTDELEVVKDKVLANGFDSRKKLVICCFDKICGTEDGQKFRSLGAAALLEDRQDKELLDFA